MNTKLFALLLMGFCFATSHLASQSDVLRVGVTHAPPYCLKDAEGNWTGMTIELWRHLAEADQVRYELVEIEKNVARPKVLANDRIDVALTTDLSYRQTDSMRFLQQHHLTTLGVALPASAGIWSIVKGVLTWQFLYIVLSLCALLFVVGTIIYFLERKVNEDQFGGDRTLAEGVGSGFWWAGVTLTTIGYGDKAPKSLPGRIAAMLWMLLAMAVSASLTASIIAATNEKNTVSFPDDLKEMKVAVMENSAAAEYLTEKGYDYTNYPTVVAAMKALNNQQVEAVVADATALNYVVNHNDGLTANVETTREGPVAFALMVSEDSGLADRLDGPSTKFILSPAWREIVKEFGGGK